MPLLVPVMAPVGGERGVLPSIMGIQHSVSQFLTRPWARRSDRMLVYYDFSTDSIQEAKSKALFAKPDVHSERVDGRFQDLIEDPLARLWHRVGDTCCAPDLLGAAGAHR